MSESVWVQADDNRWYRNPYFSGEVWVYGKPKQWFIVYDDEEPIELVMEVSDTNDPEHLESEVRHIALFVQLLFAEHGCELTVGSATGGNMRRVFGESEIDDDDLDAYVVDMLGQMRPAFHAWVQMVRPPAKLITRYDDVKEKIT